ncbi:outer membrane protein assembly factor BamD [Legionella israelensis]|uniref:outer membrane protein assembly factor BamD n=1 Tax=Legionella israelensis TaxID=454 RepID=UPI00117F7564|nr:outer membrane protein assembly factor BamD [Legionella israelensis]QDP72959.1 outer membrane protein assembly factor BamD [Legionella israelensis]
MKRALMLMILVLMGLLASCAKWWEKDDELNNPFRGMTAKQLFIESEQALKAGQYATASKRLEALESMYPFSDYAEKAQLNLIYAYYQNEDYPSAAATAERFIHLYPRAKNVDYAYYMKGLANFQQSRGTFAKWLPMDESERDPGTQSLAYSDFGTLIQKFPNSRYKANALQRMIYLRNMFAQRELNAATYYFERKMYVAAAERAGFLVKNYPQAPSAQKALLIMRDANLALGLNKAAEEALAVYEATYHKKPEASKVVT